MDSFLLRSYTYIMHFISFTIIQQLVLAYKYIRIRLNLLEIFANSSFIFMSSASSLIIRKKKKKIFTERNYIMYPNLHDIRILFFRGTMMVIFSSLRFKYYIVLEADSLVPTTWYEFVA